MYELLSLDAYNAHRSCGRCTEHANTSDRVNTSSFVGRFKMSMPALRQVVQGAESKDVEY